jgi:hypothetical protein
VTGDAAPADDLSQHDACGDRRVERLDGPGHRDRHGDVAGLAHEPGQTRALGPDDQHERAGGELEVVE